MYGLSAQTLPEALSDLRRAIALQPTHLSHYQLTLEPGTPFFHRPPQLPDDEQCYAMQLECQALLAEAGYQHYEVSAYAKRGFRSVHNLNYWQFGDYFGIGAGAHGKLTHNGLVTRTERVKQPRQYLTASVDQRLVQHPVVNEAELPFEFMLNVLRLRDGFEQSLFEQRTGLPWSSIAERVVIAEQRGLLARTSDQLWVPTPMGRQFLNDLVSLFLAN